MKKIFIISSVLLFLVGSFFLVYNFLLVDKSDIKNNKVSEVLKNNEENKSNPDKIEKIIDADIKSLTLNRAGSKIQYYNSSDKGFWEASFDGSLKNKLSNDDFSGLKNVIWNSEKDRALLEMDNAFYFYSFGNKERLIKKTEALNWINFNQRIVYSYEDYSTKKRTLNISMPDGSDWKELATLGNDDLKISYIPNSAKASFWLKPDAYKESNITIIPVGGENLEKIGDLKWGADYLWSNDGNMFLRSSVSQKGGNNLILESCDAKTNKCNNLNLPTLVAKCVWAKNNKDVYCALPTNIGKNIVMPNDYFDNKIFTKDIFWKINIENGKKEKIIDEKYIDSEMDATSLVLSPSEDFLFFINKKDGRVFRIVI